MAWQTINYGCWTSQLIPCTRHCSLLKCNSQFNPFVGSLPLTFKSDKVKIAFGQNKKQDILT